MVPCCFGLCFGQAEPEFHAFAAVKYAAGAFMKINDIFYNIQPKADFIWFCAVFFVLVFSLVEAFPDAVLDFFLIMAASA